MGLESVFVDSWGWIALGHRRDSRHDEVKLFYQELCDRGVGIYTSDYILDEVITLLFRRENFSEALQFLEGIFQSATIGNLIIERITSKLFSHAWAFRKKFQDKPLISFTDFTSMAIMQEHGIKRVLTEDEHFSHVGMGFLLVP